MFGRMPPGSRALGTARRSLAVFALAVSLDACASLSFERTTETSGRFTSSGMALTLLSVDFPKSALQIARENASDSNLANLQVQRVLVVPYLGPLDWLLDIVGVRYARISGTWGFQGR